MSQICVTFRSITAAQNAARALEQAGLPAQVLRTPRALQAPTVTLSYHGKSSTVVSEEETIRQLLTDERIAFRRLYRRGADGAWQEAEP